MRKLAIFALLVQVCTITVYGSDYDLLSRRERKEVQRIFGEGIQTVVFPLPEDIPGSGSLIHQGDLIYSLVMEEELQGFLLSTRAKGRFDYFDYSIVFSKDLVIQGVIVTTYRSTQGAGICNKKWLTQFGGYAGGELKLGKNIDSISGSTLSAGSIVADIQRCRNVMVLLREQQVTEDLSQDATSY